MNSVLHIKNKKYHNALQYHFDNLKIAQDMKLYLIMYKYYNRKTSLYQMKGKLNKCIEWGVKRLEVGIESNNNYFKRLSFNALGVFHSWQGNKEEGFKCFQKGILIAENDNEIYSIQALITTMLNLSQVKIEFGFLEEGKKILENASNKLNENVTNGNLIVLKN